MLNIYNGSDEWHQLLRPVHGEVGRRKRMEHSSRERRKALSSTPADRAHSTPRDAHILDRMKYFETSRGCNIGSHPATLSHAPRHSYCAYSVHGLLRNYTKLQHDGVRKTSSVTTRKADGARDD